ncbi:MAG: lysine biosynthesis protein LysW [Fidelibacterota bacterium]|nr:MAG: lysine biosynthesis protein LysW [Candidatus Neomarinimicrobiota bacterium]
MSKSQQSPCPECGYEIAVAADTVKGEILQCGDCGMELEVINIEPLEVAPAPEEEEDWGE